MKYRIHCQLVSVFGNGLELRPKKLKKLQSSIKLKLKNNKENLKPETNLETSTKKHKTSFKTHSSGEERSGANSRVEFKLPNLIYQPRTIET